MLEVVSNWRRPRPGLILPPWYPRAERPKHRRKQEGMLWVPKKGVMRVEHNTGAVGSANLGTSVTTGGASSTKGSAAVLLASTSFEAYWMTIIASGLGSSAVASQGSMDIMIGAATEEVIIPDLLAGYCGSFGSANVGPKIWDFPLYIPAGSRLTVKAASVRTTAAFLVALYLYGGDGMPPFRPGGKVKTYGMGTVPDGTTVAPGASGAEGSWAQITASTSEDHFALVPSFQPSADTALNGRVIAVDLGVGAATEEEIAQSYWFHTDTAEHMEGPIPSIPTFQDIPSGSRLTMRASNSGTNDAYNGVIHAVS